ncbi:hypothetical protein QA596_02760 [Balneolales bacterium ANBcel1]|nr:hypothetical protein [Balneolales bacterium ANBcel1]
MKNFKNVSVLATITFAFLLTSCTGITSPNLNEADGQMKFDAQDFQAQDEMIEQYEGPSSGRGDVIRIRPD